MIKEQKISADNQIQAYNRLTGVKAILRELCLYDIPSSEYYVDLLHALEKVGAAQQNVGWDPNPEKSTMSCKVVAR
jgi:hypothetical protein